MRSLMLGSGKKDRGTDGGNEGVPARREGQGWV